jgi:hypothetical protein
MLKSSNIVKKSENLHELHLLVYYVVKKISSDSKKVVMHVTTKAYVSHTRHCHLARDLHSYVRCVIRVARIHLKLFFGCLWIQTMMLCEVL